MYALSTCPRGSGRSIALAVGGALESLHVVPGSMDIIAKRRQGFVRLACETGASIVPVISFGENDLFTSEVVPPESAFGKFQKCAPCPEPAFENFQDAHRLSQCPRAS